MGQALPNVQRADALGAADLVGGDGDEVRSQAFGGEGHLQKPLDRIGVEEGVPASEQGGHLLHRVAGAGLVIHQHHGHQGGVRPQGLRHLACGDAVLPVRFQIGDGIPLLLQILHALEYGAVLHGGGDDVLAQTAVLPQGSADGPVVPLRTAGGEEEPLRRTAQGGGNGAAVGLQGSLGRPAQVILGGGVAKPLRQSFHHGLRHGAGHRGGGSIVQIVQHGIASSQIRGPCGRGKIVGLCPCQAPLFHI